MLKLSPLYRDQGEEKIPVSNIKYIHIEEHDAPPFCCLRVKLTNPSPPSLVTIFEVRNVFAEDDSEMPLGDGAAQVQVS